MRKQNLNNSVMQGCEIGFLFQILSLGELRADFIELHYFMWRQEISAVTHFSVKFCFTSKK